MKTKLTSLTHWAANTPPVLFCLLFALVISTNCWATDPTDVTWDGKTEGCLFPSGSTESPAVSTKSGITLRTNCPAASAYVADRYPQCYSYESAPTNNYIDITTNGQVLTSVYVSIVYIDGSGANSVKIAFSSASTYSAESPVGEEFYTITGTNKQAEDATCTISAPAGAYSARIYRTDTGWGPYLHRIRVIAQDPSATPSCALSLGVTDKTVQAGESFSLNVSTAAGYDGEISYSVSPAGMVTLDNGTVTAGSTNGLAVITVTASTTENYEGDTKKCFVHVNNFAGNLTASEDAGTVSLNWFYNLPISLATPGDIIKRGSATSSSSYADGIRTVTYSITAEGGKSFHCVDFKTPDGSHTTPNCKSFSFEYKGDGNNGTNPRVVPYSWVSGAANGDIVADKVDILDTWQEATVTPAYYFNDANVNMKGSGMDYNYYTYPSGCVAFFAMSDGTVSGGTLQLRNAYYQIINTNGLTSSVKLVRKDGSAPANASDGTTIYTDAPSTYEDNSGLVAGHTYYYRVFVTYNTVVYASNAVSITMPGTAKKDPELSLPASSAVLKVGDTYTLEPTVASGYDGTLAYEITAGSDKISLSGSTITAEAAGTATVRVTAPETTEYNQVTANFTVTVLAVPETNLAITNVDGDNVTLSWTIPGIIDLSTARTERSSSFATNYSGVSNTTSSALINNGEELDVTYSAAGKYSYNGFFFDVDLTSIESVSFDYKGDNPGGAWKGILPGIYDGSTLYWESSKGTFGLAETSWTSKTVAPSNNLWKSGTYSSGDISELCFLVYAEGDPVSGHVYLRNLRYHCTGMTDIDHIVIMRTTSAEATDTVSGTKIYSGKMSHFVDTESKAAGLYYYTIFAVYEDACFPIEYVTLNNRSFSITYKDKGDAEFSGTHETGYPTTHSNAAATALKKASKIDYIFAGWFDNSACTGNPVSTLAAGAYDADITLYARWEQLSLHEPGKYQAPTSEGGYGRVLKSNNGHDYEVYMMTFDETGRACTSSCSGNYVGELYAGSVTNIHDGYKMFSGSNGNEVQSEDGWMAFKPYKYYGGDGSCNIDEFKKLDGSGSIHSARYARLSSDHYVRLYVQGYVEFAFYGKDYKIADGEYFEVRIDGESKTYEPSADAHVARYTLTPNEPHFIEISSNANVKKENNFYGFSLRLPDVEHYTVTVAKNDNSYGTVSAATIPNVRAGEATYITDNTVYIAGTTVTATQAENTAQYTYTFNNWSAPNTITEATTVTANFTRTANDYTLTWDLNGGTVTTAGTGAAVDATGTQSSSVAYGTEITVPVVAKEGSEFVGWNETPSATMPAENTTYTAQWYAPYEITSAGIRLDASKVYPLSTPAPSLINFDADGNGVAELCLDIKNNGFAEWKARITPGYYQITMVYGTPEAAVKVQVQVFDHLGNPLAQTIVDAHSSSESLHYQAKLGLDLRDCDQDEIYTIKVVDVYNGTGSLPKVAYIDFALITPTAISKGTQTHLDNTNVASPYKIEEYDIENDGEAETCLFIGDQHQADWLVTIAPDIYNINIYYGRTTGTKLNLYIYNSAGETVYTSDQKSNPSANYEIWTISGVDLTGFSANEQYIVRIKDTYGADWSRPYIAYIDFVGKTVQIPAETRLDAENSISALTFATDLDIDDDGNNDKLMNLKNSTAEWMAQITPGVYNVSLIYGVPAWGIEVSVKLIDPTGEEEERYLSTNPSYYQSAVKDDNEQQLPHHHVGTTLCDLTGLTPGKKYKVQVADEWDGGCNLRVSHVLFTPIEPVAIPTERRLDITNTISSPTMATDLDIDGDNTLDELMNLNQNKGNAEWIVKITQGIYDVKLTYGAPEYSIRVVAKLIDPSGEEADRYLSADPYYYESGAENVPHYHTSTTRCDFSSITEDKIYKVVIEDAYGGTYGCELRVSHLEFARPVDTHTRTNLRAGDYGTICLPYAVAAADRNGAELFELEQWADNGASLTISQLNADENMVAGRPYLFQATANTATFSYYPEGDAAEAQTYNGLIGKYEEMEIPMNDDNYIIYNNKLYLVNSANIWVGANRAYIHKDGAPMNQAPANRRRVTLGVYGTQTATGFDPVTGNPSSVTLKYIENGHLFIIRDGKTYNAQGQVVK